MTILYFLMNARRYATLLFPFWLLTAAAHAEDPPLRPRPIEGAERQAVALAATYFDAGAESWWDLLADDAPLRALGRQDALAEIRVRLGPVTGATWRLETPAESYGPATAVFALYYPSGFDETLVLELAPHEAWKIRRISTRADPATGPQPRLAPLLPLRDALAEGRTGELEQLFAAPPEDPSLRLIAKLWESQYRLESLDLRKALQLFSSATEKQTDGPPLVALQRARLRLHQLDSVRTSLDYVTAIEQGIDHDGLRSEAAEAERLLGFLDEEAYKQLGRMGTRTADVYYRLARTATFYKDADAEELFRLAWRLTPLVRADIFSDPVLAQLAVRPAIHKLLQLDSDREPLVTPPETDRRPLALPAAARLKLLGSRLAIVLGNGKIVVPGGGVLAPTGTLSEDASVERSQREEEALAEFDNLAQLARSPEAFTNLRLRGKLETAALALRKRENWDDLLRLTDGMASEVTAASASLSTLRAIALIRTGRQEEAGTLLVALTKHAAESKTRDIGPLVVLAELCAEQRRFKTAIDLLRKADAELPSPVFSSRIQKIKLELSIARSDNAVESPNFRVRYTDALAKAQAINVAKDLENERERLRAWIPVRPGAAAVEVHLFPYQEFAKAYGYGTLGLFDGKMRIPFIDTADFQIVLSGVLSHELAHAMIESTTGRARAPHWLHEGLAQLLEMERGFDHPQRDEHERRLALSVVDSAFETGRGSELQGMAYNVSAWLLYFIQDRFGIPGIHKVLKLFAEGKDSETVIAQAFDLSLSEFYGLLDAWHRNDAAQIIATKQAARREWEAKRAGEAKKDLTWTPDGRAIPKASFLPPSTPDTSELEEQIDELVDKMLGWHRVYAAKTREIKKSLRPVVENFRAEARMPLGDACQQLTVGTRLLLADKQLFDCPDARINEPLRAAYRHFNLAGSACTQGKTALVQAELRKGEQKLTSVFYLLKPYGLRP